MTVWWRRGRAQERLVTAGKLKLLLFMTRAPLGLYADLTQIALATAKPADEAAVCNYRSKAGIGVNLEQATTDDSDYFSALVGHRTMSKLTILQA